MAAALAVGSLLASAASSPHHPRWNVVLVMADTLRADHLGLYGYARATSPHLDRFAAGAWVFERARSQAACTFPSVNSLLTSQPIERFFGQPEGRLGIPPEIPTLAERLRAAGYATVAVSASPIVRRSPTRFNPSGGFEAGFDTFDEACLWQAAGCVNARTWEHLEALREPFFLYLHYIDPHGPYAPPGTHLRRFAERGTALRDFAREGDARPLTRLSDPGARREFLRPGELQHLIDLYDDEIAYLDGELGRLFEGLVARGLAARTLLVFTADHGEAFLEHGHARHCVAVYDEETRVPLIVRVPGQAARRLALPAQALDVVPTVLSLLGQDAGSMDPVGRPLWAASGALANGLAFSAQGAWSSADDGRFKLIEDLRDGSARVFDLWLDAGELRDRGGQDRDRRDSLRAALHAWRSRVADGRDTRRLAEEAQERLRAVGYVD